MASPFAKYTGEQIQPINILPATTEMARQRYEAIAGLGKNLGDVIAKYSQTQQERDELAQFAQPELTKWVVQDLQNPEDRQVFKADENAPAHSAELINLALKEGDGDVAKGMAAIPLSKLRAWSVSEGKFQKAVQQETENSFKARGLELDAERIRVAQAANELAKKEYALREADEKRKQEGYELDKKKTELFRSVTDLTGVPTRTQMREIQATTIEEIGDIFDKNGELIASNVMLRDGMEALGLKPEDVITQAQAVAIKNEGTEGFKFNAVGKYLTQNDKFNYKAPFSEAIQNGWAEPFIRNAFKQANAWSLEKTGKELTGLEALFPQGFDGKISNIAKAYELAAKYSQNPAFVDYIKAQGVNVIPDGAAFNKAFYTVTGTQSYTPTVIHNIELNEAARLRIRYDQIAAAAGGSDKLPLSLWQIMAMQPDKFLPSSEIQMPDGTTQRVYKAGKEWVPATSLVGLGEPSMPKTEAELNIASADKWLKGFNKPQQFGNIAVQFVGGINNFAGKWSEDYPLLRQGFEDVKQTGQIANEMRKYVNKGLLSKVMDVEARNRFDSLVMRATTYRKYFIAGGQETEPDAQRLFDIVGAMSTSRMVFKEAHLAAINAFESILRDKVVGQARQNGFRVSVNQGGQKFDLKKIIADVEAENAKQGLTTPSK